MGPGGNRDHIGRRFPTAPRHAVLSRRGERTGTGTGGADQSGCNYCGMAGSIERTEEMCGGAGGVKRRRTVPMIAARWLSPRGRQLCPPRRRRSPGSDGDTLLGTTLRTRQSSNIFGPRVRNKHCRETCTGELTWQRAIQYGAAFFGLRRSFRTEDSGLTCSNNVVEIRNRRRRDTGYCCGDSKNDLRNLLRYCHTNPTL